MLKLSRDNKTIALFHTESDLYKYMHRKPYSVDWACKYEGYKIEHANNQEITAHVLDNYRLPFIDANIIMAFYDFIRERPNIRYEDYAPYRKEYNSDRNAAYRQRVQALATWRKFQHRINAHGLDKNALLQAFKANSRMGLEYGNNGDIDVTYITGQLRAVEYRDAANDVMLAYLRLTN